ncbi:hypothetical protein SAMN05216352_11839 [Alteribacillus bidgolensis]|uniref:Uncharacterized protein n=1 Tax=Alteribacillus bidgolensis TaxID=930129 RepID=A0A1G8Q8M0_9BACI|nr:hypothetical protein SAMN05216352_11839 [Alteribacillus bidgolensis]
MKTEKEKLVVIMVDHPFKGLALLVNFQLYNGVWE